MDGKVFSVKKEEKMVFKQLLALTWTLVLQVKLDEEELYILISWLSTKGNLCNKQKW